MGFTNESFNRSTLKYYIILRWDSTNFFIWLFVKIFSNKSYFRVKPGTYAEGQRGQLPKQEYNNFKILRLTKGQIMSW